MLGKGGVPMSPVPGQSAPPPKLDRQGNYISPAVAHLQPAPRNLAGHVVLRGPGAEPVPAQGAIVGYRADSKSWSRGMDAWDLARLLDLAFRHSADDLADGFVINLSIEEFGKLDGNLRQHFMAVRAIT